MLAASAYGKSKIRMVQVLRHGERHDLRDLTVAIRFEGEYDESYTDGDNSQVLPTDTMKNTVYAMAAKQPVGEPETFGMRLASHFLNRNPRLRSVRIDLHDHPWGRIVLGGREHGQTFLRQGPERRTVAVDATRSKATVESGVTELVILKSSRSAFDGYLHDEYTTLKETRDRILATSLTASWQYRDHDVEFGTSWRAVRNTLLEAFAEHESESVQHTMHTMGQSVLDSIEEVVSIRLLMPNKHHLPFDLIPLGFENRNEVFLATDEPHGLIEATLVRLLLADVRCARALARAAWRTGEL
jgi:urate oxidase